MGSALVRRSHHTAIGPQRSQAVLGNFDITSHSGSQLTINEDVTMGKKRGHEVADNDIENKHKKHRLNGSRQSLDQMISQESEQSSKPRSTNNYTQTSPPATEPSSNPVAQETSPNSRPFVSSLPPPISINPSTNPTKTKIKPTSLSPLPPLPPIHTTSLQDLPFTHQGILGGVPLSTATTQSYQRLEFLGDAYLELIASRLLYTTFPYWTPGRLSMKREQLVKNETLAGYALGYGFQQRARLPEHLLAGGAGPGRGGMSAKERDKAEKSWNKILGDIFEAYVAAVVLDAGERGFERAEKWMRELWMPLNQNQIEATENPPQLDFPKVELSKRIMAKGIRIDYRHEIDPDTVRQKGKFTIGAYLTGWGWEDVFGAWGGLEVAGYVAIYFLYLRRSSTPKPGKPQHSIMSLL
ncbi:ribonuclease 3 [Physcia stellaris]|nr:ribonuclease 3 [Physcia stellaris]